jgi:hypothetical protein
MKAVLRVTAYVLTMPFVLIGLLLLVGTSAILSVFDDEGGK